MAVYVHVLQVLKHLSFNMAVLFFKRTSRIASISQHNPRQKLVTGYVKHVASIITLIINSCLWKLSIHLQSRLLLKGTHGCRVRANNCLLQACRLLSLLHITFIHVFIDIASASLQAAVKNCKLEGPL